MTTSEENLAEARAIEDGEEEEEECGWCKWMKAGGCTDEFQVWLDCVDKLRAEGREDVEKCADIMEPLWACMAKNKEYYAPQLESLAEKKAAKQEDGSGVEQPTSSEAPQQAPAAAQAATA